MDSYRGLDGLEDAGHVSRDSDSTVDVHPCFRSIPGSEASVSSAPERE